jgi:hypothetical protein
MAGSTLCFLCPIESLLTVLAGPTRLPLLHPRHPDNLVLRLICMARVMPSIQLSFLLNPLLLQDLPSSAISFCSLYYMQDGPHRQAEKWPGHGYGAVSMI